MKIEQIEALLTEGRQVVAVVGLGFVGTAVVANLVRIAHQGERRFFVIGLDRDDAAGNAKVGALDRGEAPVYAGDPSLGEAIGASLTEPRNLAGSVDPEVVRLADVVICCINLDVNRSPGQLDVLSVPVDGYADALRSIGRHMRPGALVCIESTLPVGISDTVLYPALCEGQTEQGVDVQASPPLYAYCYERVMPGPDYLDSVNRFWRSFAGIDEASGDAAEAFLSVIVDTENFPLWRHKTVRAAEVAKLLENAYRATNIAFIEEWSRLAEGVGVDLIDVINSIKVRPTHNNMMRPGLGVGGYCLTKDALLARYGARELLGLDLDLPFSEKAILTNEEMPVAAIDWVRAHFDGLCGRRVALIGVTYRPGVADSRSSATEIVARAVLGGGGTVTAWDPMMSEWPELPEVALSESAHAATDGADAVVICLPDGAYRSWLSEELLGLRRGALVVDPWDMVGDALAGRLSEAGIALRVYGRGDLP